MRLIHVVPDIGPEAGGLGEVAIDLSRTLSARGIDSTVWTLSSADSMEWAADRRSLRSNEAVAFACTGPRSVGYSHTLQRALAGTDAGGTIVHQHGIWLGLSAAVHRWSSHAGGKVVIAPHGSLDQWAIARSRTKKWVASRLYENANLRRAACLHALSGEEAAALRKFGLKNPIAVLPNGVNVAWAGQTLDSESFRARHHISPEAKVLLFLSRLHPKKGLDLLFQAIAERGAGFQGWILLAAGSGEPAYERELATLAASLGISDSIRFVGHLGDPERRQAFGAAQAFVLPSRSEGFPMAALEALACGVPVLTTTAFPGAFLAETRSGWRVPPEQQSITAGLAELTRSSLETLSAMGSRGKEYVLRELTWERTAARVAQVYQWLLGMQEVPECVRLV